MNKDAQGRWKVGMSNTKLKMRVNMSNWLTERQLVELQRGYQKRVETPVPTQVVSSGECFPPPQTRRQAQVESLIHEHADMYSTRQGMHLARYLRSRCGMAVAFLAMNQVYGDIYTNAERPLSRSG